MWWTDIIPMLIQRYSADNNDICIPKNNTIIQLIKLLLDEDISSCFTA